MWTEAIKDWGEHKYNAAAKGFIAIKAKQSTLSADQVSALTRAIDEMGQEAFKAADGGSADALEAVKTLRSAEPNGGRR